MVRRGGGGERDRAEKKRKVVGDGKISRTNKQGKKREELETATECRRQKAGL